MSGNLVLTVTLERAGGPGAEWSGVVDDGNPTTKAIPFGPTSSAGELLELVGQALDAGETEAIINARRSSADDTE